MVGLSHSALRTLIFELGGIGLFFTEMLSAKRLPSENETVSPFLFRSTEEWPLFYQLFLSQNSEIEPVVERLEELDAQGIDINLGCPAPQLRKLGAGLELFKDKEKTYGIIRSLRRRTNLPISVKIRLGNVADSIKLRDTCLRFQDSGVDLITVHARCDHEKFCRKPHWQVLESSATALSIPMLANGGIFCVDDAKKCLALSGAAGLMIGRGAVQKPWLFREIATALFHFEPDSSHLPEHEVYLRFIVLLNERFAPERRLGRLKQFTHYFAANYAFGHQFSSRIQNCKTMQEATDSAIDFFKKRMTTEMGGEKNDRAH